MIWDWNKPVLPFQLWITQRTLWSRPHMMRCTLFRLDVASRSIWLRLRFLLPPPPLTGATLKILPGKLMEVAKLSDDTSKQLRKEILTCGGSLVLLSGIVCNQRQTSKTLAGVITSGLHAAAGKTLSNPHNASKCWCNVALIAAY